MSYDIHEVGIDFSDDIYAQQESILSSDEESSSADQITHLLETEETTNFDYFIKRCTILVND